MGGINGDQYSWSDMTIILRTGVVIDIQEINYGDEVSGSPRYGKGKAPIGWGSGNYKGNGSITLGRDEMDALRLAMFGKIYDGTAEIAVSYGGEDQVPRVDIMPSIKFKKQDTGGKQGEERAGDVKLDFECLKPIKWNFIDAV